MIDDAERVLGRRAVRSTWCTGPVYFRLMTEHAPLDDEFVTILTDYALRGLNPPRAWITPRALTNHSLWTEQGAPTCAEQISQAFHCTHVD